jgi:sigma-70-like protein
VYLPQDAEDATQEILVKLMTKLSTFVRKSSFRTWLYGIVVNHVLNMRRGRAECGRLDLHVIVTCRHSSVRQAKPGASPGTCGGRRAGGRLCRRLDQPASYWRPRRRLRPLGTRRTGGAGRVLAPFAVDQAALLCSVGPEDPRQVDRGEFRGPGVD